jgi:hypothetical protein
MNKKQLIKVADSLGISYRNECDKYVLEISSTNQITIKPVKENWNKSELDLEINIALNKLLCQQRDNDLINNPSSNKIAKWITKNI